MAFYKNVASQKIPVYAFDEDTGLPATGEAANITAEISKDGGTSAATNDTNPAELDATDHPGVYLFDMTQSEMNADLINLTAVCSSSGIQVDPVMISTLPGSSSGIHSAVQSVATDAINAAAIATDAVNEIQSGLATSSALATVDNNVDAILLDTDELQQNQGDWATYDGSDTPGTTTLLSRLTATRAGYLDNLSAGAVATASKLLKYVQLLFRKDAAIATDNATELTEINANGGSGAGSANNQTDSQEAIRDRGDSAWVTATGFSTHSAANVVTAMEGSSTKLSLIADIEEGDHYIDKSGSPWQLVITKKGTGGPGVGTELVRKDINDVDGTALVSTATVRGQFVEPA